jgi:hypothetical protein
LVTEKRIYLGASEGGDTLFLRSPPTTPQLAFLYATLVASMLGGGSVVHAVLKPDLSLPKVAAATENST